MTYAKKHLHNVQTGRVEAVDLTADEIQERDALKAASEQQEQQEQQAEVERQADLQPAHYSQIAAVLAAIAAERVALQNVETAITADLANLQAASSLAAVKPIVASILQRQQQEADLLFKVDGRLEVLIKAVGRLIQQGR